MSLLYLTKYVRLRLGLTQGAVAAAADMPQKTLSGIESGRIVPTTDELDRLSRVLNVPPDTLMMSVEVDLPVPPVARALGYLRPVEEPVGR